MKDFILHIIMCFLTCGAFHMLDAKYHVTELLGQQIGFLEVEKPAPVETAPVKRSCKATP